ncbi:MAG TPA: crosslink repair DNA glycosylase YcaQ family protein, partial [Micromonosporaceae bacterium]|nr:crosslink repair DNA glycosylase YcaQ family protein [Micromonosporaceae bacterium]
RRVLGRVGVLQIDSVNVLQRAHYLPLYSRLGPYPTRLLDQAAYGPHRRRNGASAASAMPTVFSGRLFEYWGHAASYLPVELYPLFHWRMNRDHVWPEVAKIAKERPELLDWVREEVAANGPITAAELEADVPRRSGNWGWNWSDAKIVLEWLFWRGEVLVASRNNGFARLYDIPARVLPADVLARPVPETADAHRALVAFSAAALGVANEVELRDYFRLPVAGAHTAVAELVESGELVPVTVQGSPKVSYLHRDAKIPRRVAASTLVSPFDPIIWHRDRTERFFDFRYRIEIYVPAAKRIHGYYVLPFLLGDRMAARVDLKADRQAGVLRVPGAFAEPGAPVHTASALAAELVRLAGWLGLERVDRPVRGDLAGAVGTALRAHEASA